MTRLIARLILAMLILPLALTVLALLIAAISIVFQGGQPPVVAILLMWVVLYAFVAMYWLLLWRDVVRWTVRRRIWTLAFGALAVVCSLLFGAVFHFVFRIPGFAAAMLGGGVGPIVWVLATVLIWRETPQERIERLTQTGAESLCCPVCGYNMTGLRESRCPECGSQFTLDQLVASQPARDVTTIPDD